MKTICRTIILAAVALIPPVLAMAAPDYYVGDTAIYGGAPANVDPNVVILLDTSLSMNDATLPENPYDPGATYAASSGCGGQPCVTNTVYKCTAFGLECGNWTANTVDVSTVTTSCPIGTDPKNSLLTTGQWNSSRKKLQTSGACATGNGIYALGNWINWRASLPGSAFTPKIDIAKQVVTDLLNSTTGIRFGLFDFNNNQGAKVLDGGNGYRATVKDMDALFDATTTNRDALVYAVNKDIVADSWTPLAESLYEVGLYYQGKPSAFTTESWTSPIQASCQKNYVIIVTDGMSTADQDNVLQTICNKGDCDGDGFEPSNDPAKTYPNQGSDYLDDVAKYLHDTDLSTAFADTQNVITYTVGFGLGGSNAGAVKLLAETAANGGGKAYLSNSASELSTALQQILGQIMEVNSSFVAPVVPVSPENRTYSSGRVYLGFFKPQSGTSMWLGNLKKYGINDAGVVVDSTGTVSNYVDRNRDGIDDNTGAALPSGAVDGSFKANAMSYWGLVPDGGDVDNGGAGEVLLNRDFATNPRKIYTYTGTNVSLTDSSNAVTTTNAAITPAMLGVATAADHDKLIKYVHGWDSYDADVDGVVDEKRTWILGDILHSKPLVVNYTSYVFTSANEADCAVNKTLIFAGANDGMMHAFQDCDGNEAWAFIPPDLLSNLYALSSTVHTYFVDGSPTVYRYDADNDGNIEPAMGDRVILLFGERRGGGYYYALDVSDPVNPKYFWRLGATTSPSGVSTDYSELGQTWADTELTKIKVGSFAKMAMIIGAGYDNLNEDGRYGRTTSYNGSGLTSGSGEGNVTSAGSSGPLTPKGRGVYVVEIATVSDAAGTPIAPNFSQSGWKIWGYTYADNSLMRYSIPSSVAAVDTDYNGYIDRVYVGDTGSRMWAIDIGNTSPASWTVRRLFTGFTGILGAGDTGRKVFYPPSVVFEVGYANLAFGTGDREHPLNTAVVDRLYSLKDHGPTQTTTLWETDTPTTLVDVTADLLQTSTDPTVIDSLLSELNSKYGWYIRLENSGEKMLAPPLTFFNSYYTTYAPDATPPADPCVTQALGTGRLYVLNYKTGEAVYNYDTTNDGTLSTNSRAGISDSSSSYNLLKTDRVQTVGEGIPSGVVPILAASGKVALLVGVGGGLPQPPPPKQSGVIELYWRRVL